MDTRETLLTPEGYEKLQAELNELTTTKRSEVAERIKIAREYGDISENAEYDDAKNEQARIEARIMLLEDKLRTAKVVAEKSKNSVGIGNEVTVVEEGTKDQEVFYIVGSTEADPLENRVSNESPFGKALMGQSKGATVTVPAPKGEIIYKIVEIK